MISSSGTKYSKIMPICKNLILFFMCFAFYDFVPSSGMTLNSRVTLNSHTSSMEIHWLMSITAISQGVCVLDQSLKVSALPPHYPNFLNMPTRLSNYFFCLNNNFQMKKFDVLRKSFNWKLFSTNVSRGDVHRNHCLVCACHRLLLFWQEKFE